MSLRKILTVVSLTMMVSSLSMMAHAKTDAISITEGAGTYSASVKYTKSELASSKGVAQIFSRIQKAAYLSCKGEFSHQRFVSKRREMKKCVINVTQDLVENVGNERLTLVASYKPTVHHQLASK